MEESKKKLLVVDDVEINRVILHELFSDKYEVLETENGATALELIDRHGADISVVLLDLVMPVMDGFEVLAAMNSTGIIQSVPVILITGENDDEKALKGYGLGVSDLINKPFNSDIVLRRVNNVVDLYSHRQHLEHKLKEQKDMLEKQGKWLRQSNQFVIDALSTTVEFRNFESGDHIKRIRILVKELLTYIRDEYDITDEEIDIISNVSVMHDIGKIAIPDAILLKPGPLSDEEFEIMKTHTTRGCDILASLNHTQDIEYFHYGYEICRHHHERWDGRGYPDQLKGNEIAIWAQATALADVYDALTSKRVYKGAFSHEKAVEMILNGECGAFNPKLIDSFVQIQHHLFEEKNNYNAEGHGASQAKSKGFQTI